MTVRSSLALCALTFACAVPAQDQNISWKSTELAPGLYMLESQGGFAGGNLGLITGDDGVVLIDDGLEPLAGVTVAAIEALTGDPVNFVINTHAHGDHTGANEVLHGKGATVVAHDNLRRQLVKDGSNRATLPELTFTDAVTFHLNGHTANVFHVANAHTDGDAVIHFPEVNIIHTGDAMFNRLFPFIDLDGGGSLSGFIAAQKKIIALADDDTKIIPGHGKLANKADLRAAIDMLEDAQARIKALVDAGKSQQEVIAANPLAAYADAWTWDFISADSMTETIYRSLTAE